MTTHRLNTRRVGGVGPVTNIGGVAALLAASTFATILLSSTPALAQASNEATFCSNANYGGSCFTVKRGGGNTDLTKKGFPGGGNWNDKISSVKVGSDVRVLAYENTNWTGECVVFSGSAAGGTSGGKYPNLTSYDKANGGNWNDQISSFQVGPASYVCP
jgi:hypothetical protein